MKSGAIGTLTVPEEKEKVSEMFSLLSVSTPSLIAIYLHQDSRLADFTQSFFWGAPNKFFEFVAAAVFAENRTVYRQRLCLLHKGINTDC